jgi:uncharacterized membrane protein SirB2
MINPVLTLHVSTALISITGFIIRGILHFSGSELVNRKWFKIAPHIIDTLLIVSAVALLIQSNLNILNTPWLLAKVIALFVYIGLGLVAFRFGKTLLVRILAWSEAILVFAYILGVAVTRNPLVFF